MCRASSVGSLILGELLLATRLILPHQGERQVCMILPSLLSIANGPLRLKKTSEKS